MYPANHQQIWVSLISAPSFSKRDTRVQLRNSLRSQAVARTVEDRARGRIKVEQNALHADVCSGSEEEQARQYD